VQAEAGLPEGGTIERAGPLTCLVYRDNGLLRRLELYPAISPGLLQWQIGVCDDAVRSPTAALWTHYKPVPGLAFAAGEEPRRNFTGYRWPVSGTALDPQFLRDVARFARYFPADNGMG
jgi:hypothetical protein